MGAVAFSLCFRQLADKDAFIIMGIMIMCSSLLSVFVNISGHPRLLSFTPIGEVKKEACTSSEEDSVGAATADESVAPPLKL